MLDNHLNPLDDIKGLASGQYQSYLVNDSNTAWLENQLQNIAEHDYFIDELHNSYQPRFNKQNQRTKYGFYTLLNNELAGLSLLGVSSWKDRRGYTGADTLPHMRGKGIAPASKALLFYFGFELLNLNRIETGCLTSNLSSKKSIEKTKGFLFEGTLKEFRRLDNGLYEDEFRYAILKSDWFKLYDKSEIEIIT